MPPAPAPAPIGEEDALRFRAADNAALPLILFVRSVVRSFGRGREDYKM